MILLNKDHPDKRSGGLGGRAMKALKEYYKGAQILFSYESVFEESDNAAQRERISDTQVLRTMVGGEWV